MTIHQSDYAKGSKVAPNPAFSGVPVTHRFSMTVPADAAADDILEIAVCPPGCRPIDIVVDCDDLDSGGTPAILLDVGMITGSFGDADDATRVCGDEFFDGSDIAQAGGVARPELATAYRVAVSNTPRAIGAKIAAAAATGQAGTIGLTVTYAAE